MNYRVKLSQRPGRGINGIRFSDQLANPFRFGLIEIEFGNVRGIQIHDGSSHDASTLAILFEEIRAIAETAACEPRFPALK
jgi:hypothetical protein